MMALPPEPPTTRGRPPLARLAGLRRLRTPRTPLRPIVEGAPHPDAALRDRRHRRGLAAADLLAALAAILLATTLVGGVRLQPALLIALVLIVLMAKLMGLYDRDELVLHKTTLDEAPSFVLLAAAYTLGFWLLEGVFVEGRFDKLHAFVLWACLCTLGLLARWSVRHLVRMVVPVERCLYIGDDATRARLEEKLTVHGIRGTDMDPLPVESITSTAGEGMQLDEAAFRDEMRHRGAHRLVISPGSTDPGITLELVRAAKALGIRVSLVPQFLDVVESSVVFDDLGGMTLLGMRRLGLSRSSFWIKRVFDLVSAGSLLLTTAPFFALAALAIRLDSPGPVFFVQIRVGRDGQPFRMLKFRTMTADAEAEKPGLAALNQAEGFFKIADDPRITRVGRVLRRTSLDELPQLLNVISGQMSLVGPRPLIFEEDQAILGHDRSRLHLTPGMTGQWQILGSSRVPLSEMVKIDYLYVAEWSLWTDIKIILRTVLYMAGGRGL